MDKGKMATEDIGGKATARHMVATLPFWDVLTPGEKQLVSERASLRRFSPNQVIGSSDSSCTGVVFVMSGCIRVSLLSEEGREVTLFRVAKNECCVTTASCAIKQITFDTCVSALESSVLLVVPSAVCDCLSRQNIYFRSFMLEIEVQRYSQVVQVMQQMLFKRLDQRLAIRLVELCDAEGKRQLGVTQEGLARDINSAREAVTRALHRLSQEGLVAVRRGNIEILDLERLRTLC